jgi:hypothetical protein
MYVPDKDCPEMTACKLQWQQVPVRTGGRSCTCCIWCGLVSVPDRGTSFSIAGCSHF